MPVRLTSTTDCHFSNEGTQQIADLVVQGLRDLNLPLAAYLK